MICKDNGQKFFTVLAAARRKEARDRTPCKTISVLLQQYELALSFNNMILHTSLCVGKVDGLDTDVRKEGVLVEENRTNRKMSHVKSFLKNIVFDTIRCLLKSNNMPLSPQIVSQKRLPFHAGTQGSSWRC